ncbi:MAG TPA: hypothetical protein VIC25_10600, partial [Caulobacteraceae bacterium]
MRQKKVKINLSGPLRVAGFDFPSSPWKATAREVKPLAMRTDIAPPIRLEDYRPPDFLIDEVGL